MSMATERESWLHTRARVGLVAMGAVAAATVVGLTMGGATSPTALQSSQTLEFGSGSRAVLSSRDFVPLSNRDTPSSPTARKELAGLYAAAGMKLRSGARQQQLAEVSGSFVRPQTQIDPGSKERLNAAARGKLDAFGRGHFPEDSAELRSERSEHALGDTIAKYFRSAQKL